VIGPPNAFRADALRRLHDRLLCPWGLLTARDDAGLSFAVAKVRLDLSPRVSASLFDMLDSDACTCRSGSVVEISRLDDPRARQALSQSIDLLALRAHGDGAHMNLGPVVLCGVGGAAEQGPEGVIAGGCSQSKGVIRCKRVTDPSIDVRSPADVRAQCLVLLSCNAFNVAGDLYPSDNSLVLSAVDGWASHVIAGYRLVPIAAEFARVVTVVASAGLPPRDLWGLMNDLAADTVGGDPFVLIGDPCGSIPAPIAADAAPTADVVLVPVPGGTGAGPVEASAGGDSVVAVRGRSVVAAFVPAGTKVDVIDRSTALAQRFRWVEDCRRQLQAAWQLEAFVLTVVGSEALGDYLAELRDSRERAHAATTAACVAAGRVATNGIWDVAADLRLDVAGICIARWDCTFAEVIDAFLSVTDFSQVLANAAEATVRRSIGRCTFCGSALVYHRGRVPSGVESNGVGVHCTTCGPQLAYRRGGARLAVLTASALGPGATRSAPVPSIAAESSAGASGDQVGVAVSGSRRATATRGAAQKREHCGRRPCRTRSGPRRAPADRGHRRTQPAGRRTAPVPAAQARRLASISGARSSNWTDIEAASSGTSRSTTARCAGWRWYARSPSMVSTEAMIAASDLQPGSPKPRSSTTRRSRSSSINRGRSAMASSTTQRSAVALSGFQRSRTMWPTIGLCSQNRWQGAGRRDPEPIRAK